MQVSDLDSSEFTYEDVKEILWEQTQTHPKFKAEYENSVTALITWVRKSLAAGYSPVSLEFALEYVAAVCEGQVKDSRVMFSVGETANKQAI